MDQRRGEREAPKTDLPPPHIHTEGSDCDSVAEAGVD